jgi:hypothetical protein
VRQIVFELEQIWKSAVFLEPSADVFGELSSLRPHHLTLKKISMEKISSGNECGIAGDGPTTKKD